MKERLRKLYYLLLIVMLCCSKRFEQIPQDEILARIGERIITTNEFIERSEYTVRPEYLRGDYNVHKLMILNSLIAEKLLAREAGDTNRLAQNERFRLFINGRKEQAMRIQFLRDRIYKKIELDDDEYKIMYDLAGRTYDIAYISLVDSSSAEYVRRALFDEGLSFEDLYARHTDADSMPRREVSWLNETSGTIRDLLFGQDVRKDQVIGPVEMNGTFLFMKVMGWIDRPAISPQDKKNRTENITQYLVNKRAVAEYKEYVADLMKGKSLNFDRTAFVELVNSLGPIYFDQRDEPENRLREQDFAERQEAMEKLSSRIGEIHDWPLLTVDGRIWTIGDLEKELMRHPLQFRDRNFKKGDFARQLKLAIADLIADMYITQEAYNRGYDRATAVINAENMWRDSYLATYYRNRFLKSIGELDSFGTDYLRIIQDRLNPMVDSLQNKYSDIIELNRKAFEEIKLSHIDMFAMYESQPYPVVVPGFPVLTTDNRLNYGRAMK